MGPVSSLAPALLPTVDSSGIFSLPFPPLLVALWDPFILCEIWGAVPPPCPLKHKVGTSPLLRQTLYPDMRWLHVGMGPPCFHFTVLSQGTLLTQLVLRARWPWCWASGRSPGSTVGVADYRGLSRVWCDVDPLSPWRHLMHQAWEHSSSWNKGSSPHFLTGNQSAEAK